MKICFTSLIIAFCFSVTNAQNWQWAKSFGLNSNDVAKTVATDGLGNIYIAGQFNSDSITFGSITLFRRYSPNTFLVKFDYNGNALWARSGEGNTVAGIDAITVDANNNVYATGYFYGDSIWLGGKAIKNAISPGVTDLFVVKYDQEGNVLWLNNSGSQQWHSGESVAIDSKGNAYTLGYSTSSYFNSSSPVFFYGSVLTKYDINGKRLWMKEYYVDSFDVRGYGVTIDNFGNAYITGVFTSAIATFGSIAIYNYNPIYSNSFLAKFDTAGNTTWAKNIGQRESQSLTYDGSKNIYVTGKYFEQNNYSVFLSKYDLNCNPVWTSNAHGDASPRSVKTDIFGNIYVPGEINGLPVIFGSDSLYKKEEGQVFLTKYDSTGKIVFVKGAGGIDNDGLENAIAYDVALDNSAAYVVGFFRNSSLSFDDKTLVNNYGDDRIFMASISLIDGMLDVYPVNSSVNIYPNPSYNELKILTVDFQPQTISVYDIDGRKVIEEKYEPRIDVSTLNQGMYFLELKSENTFVRKKFIKL